MSLKANKPTTEKSTDYLGPIASIPLHINERYFVTTFTTKKIKQKQRSKTPELHNLTILTTSMTLKFFYIVHSALPFT